MVAPVQKNRLGRGLASLIGEPAKKVHTISGEVPMAGGLSGGLSGKLRDKHGEQRVVSLDLLKGGSLNPRKDFPEEELTELA